RAPGAAVAVAGAVRPRRAPRRAWPAPASGRRRLARRRALRAAPAAGERVGGHDRAAARRPRQRRPGVAGGMRARAGARRAAVAVRAECTLALSLALGRERPGGVRAAALAAPPARGRAGAGPGLARPGPALASGQRERWPPRPGPACRLDAARGEARVAAHPGAPARAVAHRRRGPGGMTVAETAKQVEIHTDGACLGNPGPGGWAALLCFRGREKEIAGGEPLTTNNRMELTAAIMALEALTEGCSVVLHTDSQYVRQGITLWLPNWLRRNWRTAGGDPVKNQDLWERLHAACARHRIDWRWVKGHSGNPGNERVDRLAREQAERFRR